MKCPYCGADLEDYASFCSACGKYALPLQNDNPAKADGEEHNSGSSHASGEEPCEKTPAKKVQRLYPLEEPVPEPVSQPVPEAEAADPAPEKTSEPPHPEKGFRAVPVIYRILLFVLLAALVGTVCGLIYVTGNTANMRAQLRRAQSDEATAVENALGLETRITELEADLDTARTEAKEKAETIKALEAQIVDMESDVTQTTYDMESAQRQLEEAQTELTALNTEITDLETKLADVESQLETANTALSEAQDENKSLTDANAALTAETEFYDSYVVFVMTTATDKYYHKFDCPNFTQKNFLAYNTKLAESNGYIPCPVCMGNVS